MFLILVSLFSHVSKVIVQENSSHDAIQYDHMSVKLVFVNQVKLLSVYFLNEMNLIVFVSI